MLIMYSPKKSSQVKDPSESTELVAASGPASICEKIIAKFVPWKLFLLTHYKGWKAHNTHRVINLFVNKSRTLKFF